MSTPAIHAGISADQNIRYPQVIDLALLERQLDGTHPFVRSFKVDAPCVALDVLPNDAAIERCVTTDLSVDLLASVRGAYVHLATSSSTSVTVVAVSHDQAEDIADEMRQRLEPIETDTVRVRVWHHRNGPGPAWDDRHIAAPHWQTIRRNYPSPVRRALDRLTAAEEPEASGKLVLWHGPPGTGKTTALRSLVRAWAPWCDVQYLTDPERFFTDADYMTRVLTTATSATRGATLTRAGEPDARWRLVVAEDSDEYLRASARRDAGAALGRLLNLVDGILGQGRKVLVLLTTNEEVSRLHPALVRPGRCLAEVEFPPFGPEHASRWLGAPVARPMTLAELLEKRGDITRLAGGNSESSATTGQYL